MRRIPRARPKKGSTARPLQATRDRAPAKQPTLTVWSRPPRLRRGGPRRHRPRPRPRRRGPARRRRRLASLRRQRPPRLHRHQGADGWRRRPGWREGGRTWRGECGCGWVWVGVSHGTQGARVRAKMTVAEGAAHTPHSSVSPSITASKPMLAATPRLTGLTARSPAPSTGRASPATGLAARAVRPSIIARAASENDATAVSGEWPVTWSLASYEDVGAFFQANVFQVRDGGREWRARARAGHLKKKKKKKNSRSSSSSSRPTHHRPSTGHCRPRHVALEHHVHQPCAGYARNEAVRRTAPV